MRTDIAPEFVDGNDMAGAVRELFCADLTLAVGQCVACGHTAMLAEAHVYRQAPGIIARCSGCEGVLMRLVRSPDRAWLDMRGMTHLEFHLARS